uniref:Uncharacterized protein n=1 Tax=Arundo donax TaxID=35708 RepID=A0A0A8ZYB1_ARUDO
MDQPLGDYTGELNVAYVQHFRDRTGCKVLDM